MRLNTALRVAVVSAMGIAVLVIGASKSLDIPRTKAALVAKAKALTGRELTIAGSLRLKVGLVPVLVAEGVSLSNVAGGSRTDMVRVEKVEAELALLPLLRKEIRVLRLTVSGPDILLEQGDGGRPNWLPTPVQAISPPAKALAATFNLREFRIKNGRVAINNRAAGRIETFNVHKLAFQPDRAGNGSMAVQLIGDHLGKNFEASGMLGHPSAIGNGTPWPVRLKGAAKGLQVAVDGSALNPLTGEGLSLKVAVQGDDVADLVRLAGLPVSVAGPYRFSGKLTDPEGRLALSEIDAAFGRRDGVFVNAKGGIRDVLGRPSADLAIGLESDSLPGAGKVAGVDGLPAGSLKASGMFKGDLDNWTLADLKVAAAGTDVAGQIGWSQGKRSKLTAQLAVGVLALPSLPVGIADQPWPIALLDRLDADVVVHAGAVSVGALRLTDAAVGAQLDRGHLIVAPLRFGVAGGAVTGTVDIRENNGKARLSLGLEGQHLEMGPVLAAFGLAGVQGGRTDLTARLRGEGGSMAGWLATARGVVAGVAGPATVEGASSVGVNCAAARLQVDRGKAVSRNGLAVDADQFALLGGGEVDLAAGTIDLRLEPVRQGGHDLIVSGNLNGPAVAWSENPRTKTGHQPVCETVVGDLVKSGANSK